MERCQQAAANAGTADFCITTADKALAGGLLGERQLLPRWPCRSAWITSNGLFMGLPAARRRESRANGRPTGCVQSCQALSSIHSALTPSCCSGARGLARAASGGAWAARGAALQPAAAGHHSQVGVRSSAQRKPCLPRPSLSGKVCGGALPSGLVTHLAGLPVAAPAACSKPVKHTRLVGALLKANAFSRSKQQAPLHLDPHMLSLLPER